MSAGMDGVILAHMAHRARWMGGGRVSVSCECGSLQTSDDTPAAIMAAHVAEELAKAGYGKLEVAA